MIAAKSIGFFLRVLCSQPALVPEILCKRGREALVNPPKGIAITHFGDVRYDVDLTLHRIARKYYFHTHEMYLNSVFRRFLKPGSVFVDIGANMGYWSAFALSLIGREGEVHAFEPVPAFFASLKRLQANNPGYKLFANQMAVGAAPGHLPMAVITPTSGNYDNFDTNIGSSSVLPGFLDHEKQLTTTIDVEVTTIDGYLAAGKIDPDRIGLIKIDVEGYESYCLDGMASLLSKPGRKIPILCEVLTDPARHEKLNGPAVIGRLEACGYRCLDATTLKPIDTARMHFEENIICVDAAAPA